MHADSLLATGRRLWIGSLLWVIGRTLCRAARVDEAVRRELAPLPDGLSIQLAVNGLAARQDAGLRSQGGREIRA